MGTSLLASERLPTLSEADECVTLGGVLAQRDAPLTDPHLWAVCLSACRALTALQHSTHLFHALCISPESLAFDIHGVVCFLDLPSEPELMYVPPEYDTFGNSYKAHLYSLGMTLLYASEYNMSPGDREAASVGDALSDLMTSMTADEYEERASLRDVMEHCQRHLVAKSADAICRNLANFSMMHHSLKDKYIDLWNGNSLDNWPSEPMLNAASRGQHAATEPRDVITPPAPFRCVNALDYNENKIVGERSDDDGTRREAAAERRREDTPADRCDAVAAQRLCVSRSNPIGCNGAAASRLPHGHAPASSVTASEERTAAGQSSGDVDCDDTADGRTDSGTDGLTGEEGARRQRTAGSARRTTGMQSVQEILECLGCSLLENEVWALCRECMLALQRRTDELPTYIAIDTVFVEKTGRVSYGGIGDDDRLEWLYLAPELQKCGVVTLKTCVFGVAAMLWSAADYSYSQNEAPELSSQFENLVSAMTRENPTQRLTVSEVLQVCEHYKQSAPSLTVCRLFASDAHKAGAFGQDNLLVRTWLDDEMKHESLRHRAQLLESIRKARTRLKPVADRQIAELHTEKCLHERLMDDLKRPPVTLKKTSKPVLPAVKKIFDDDRQLMAGLDLVTLGTGSRVADDMTAGADGRSAFKPVSSQKPSADSTNQQASLPTAYSSQSTHFSPIVLPGRRQMPKLPPASLSAAERQSRVALKLRAYLARSRLPTRLARDPETAVEVAGSAGDNPTEATNQQPAAVAAETVAAAAAVSAPFTRPVHVQLQHDPTTGYFQILPLGGATTQPPFGLAPLAGSTPLGTPALGMPAGQQAAPRAASAHEHAERQQSEQLGQLLQLLQQQQQQLKQQESQQPELIQLLKQLQKQTSMPQASPLVTYEMSPMTTPLSVMHDMSSVTPETSPVTDRMSPVTLHTLPVTRQMSPVTNQVSPVTTSPVTLATSPLTYQTSPVTLVMSPVTHQTSPVTNQMSPMTTSPVTLHTLPVTRQMSPVTLQTSPVTPTTSPVTLKMSPVTRSPIAHQTSPVTMSPVTIPRSTMTHQALPVTNQVSPMTTSPVTLATSPVTYQTSPVTNQVSPPVATSPVTTSPVSLQMSLPTDQTSPSLSQSAFQPDSSDAGGYSSQLMLLGGSTVAPAAKAKSLGDKKKSRLCNSTRRINYLAASQSWPDDEPAGAGSNSTSDPDRQAAPPTRSTYKTTLRLDNGLSRSQPNIAKVMVAWRDPSPPPSPSWSKDSGVSGVQQPRGDAALLDRLLTSEAALLGHRRRRAAVAKLLRDEFAFDGYMENGVEDVAMAEYIYSLGGLKWDTFSNAIAEKYSDLFWQESLVSSLYEAVNGRLPTLPTRNTSESTWFPHTCVDDESSDTLSPPGGDPSASSITRSSYSESAFRPIRTSESGRSVASDCESRATAPPPPSRVTRSNSLFCIVTPPTVTARRQSHVPAPAAPAAAAPNTVSFADDVCTPDDIFVRTDDEWPARAARRDKARSTYCLYGSDDARRKDSDQSDGGNGNGQSGRLLSANSENYLDVLAAARHLSDPPPDRSAGQPADQSDDQSDDRQAASVSGHAASTRQFDRGGVVYYRAETARRLRSDVRQWAGQMESQTRVLIEEKLADLGQQTMLEHRNKKKTQVLYRRLVEATKSNKVTADHKGMMTNVLRQLAETTHRLQFLDAATKHLEMLHAEQWGVEHDLLHALAHCPGDTPMLLSPAPLTLVQLDGVEAGVGAVVGAGAARPTVHSGTPLGLLAYLFARHALADGFIHQFFYCYRYFLAPRDVLAFITDKYAAATVSLSPAAPTPTCVKARALDLLQVWLEGYYSVDFKYSQETWRSLLAFIKGQVAPHEPSADVLLELMDDCSEGQHVDLHYPQFIACDTEDKVGSVEPIKKWESFKAALRLNAKPAARVEKSRPVLLRKPGGSTVPPSRYEAYYPGVGGAERGGTQEFSLADYRSEALAEQLTLMEQELFHQSHPVNFLNSKTQGVSVSLSNPVLDKLPPNRMSSSWQGDRLSNLFVERTSTNETIQGLIEHAQNVAFWVAAEVLSCSSVKVQIGVLTKLIFTARACHQLRNFASCISIVDGLQNIIVRQLPAWRSLPSKCKSVMDELAGVRIFLKTDPLCLLGAGETSVLPTIPSILTFLLHVQQLEIGGFTLANGMIKWTKMVRLTEVVDQVRRFRQHPYRLAADVPLQRALLARMTALGAHDVHTLAIQHDSNMQKISSGGGMQGALRRWRGRFS